MNWTRHPTVSTRSLSSRQGHSASPSNIKQAELINGIPLWAREWQGDSIRGGKTLFRRSGKKKIWKRSGTFQRFVSYKRYLNHDRRRRDPKSVLAGQLFAGLESAGQYFCQSACISVVSLASNFSQTVELSANQSLCTELVSQSNGVSVGSKMS